MVILTPTRRLFWLAGLLIGSSLPALAEDLPAPDASIARIEIQIPATGVVPYVGEMVLADLRGYYDIKIGKEVVEAPAKGQVDWVQLDKDDWGKEQVGPRQLTVFRRRLALFPTRAGTLTIDPFLQHLTVIGNDGVRFERQIASAPVTLDAAPLPGDAGDWWLPARWLELSDVWDKDPATLHDDETVTRTVTLRALGVTPAMLPPAPGMRVPGLITFETPEERSIELTPEGPIATAIWRWKFRPITGGVGLLPEVRIPWFDTVSRVRKDAVLEAASVGLAGLGDNAGTNWAADFQRPYLVGLAALAGLAGTFALLLPGLGLSAPGRRRGVFRRFLPDPARAALRRAVRRGDAVAAHHAADALVPRPDRDARAAAAMAALERYLYGRNSRVGGFDLKSFGRHFARRVRATDPRPE